MNHVIADGPMSAARPDSGTAQKRWNAFLDHFGVMHALNLSSGPLHSPAVLPLPFGPSNQTCSIRSGDVWGCSRTYYERQWHKQSRLYLAHSETERNCCLRLLSMHPPPRTQEWLKEWLILILHWSLPQPSTRVSMHQTFQLFPATGPASKTW